MQSPILSELTRDEKGFIFESEVARQFNVPKIEAKSDNQLFSRIDLGIAGEKFIVKGLDLIMKNSSQRDNYRIGHTTFDPKYYCWGTGVDGQVFIYLKSLIDYEVKNWRYSKRLYSIRYLKEIVDRFKDSVAPIKILFISYLCILAHKLIDAIRDAGIIILELGVSIQPNATSFGSHLQTFVRNFSKTIIVLFEKSKNNSF